MSKLQSSLTAIERPRCPRCQARLPLVAMERSPDGFDQRTFECAKCGQSRTIKIAADPMKSNSAGWLSGELKPPT
jgi:transposase-like protein